jgi:hypothetical protein
MEWLHGTCTVRTVTQGSHVVGGRRQLRHAAPCFNLAIADGNLSTLDSTAAHWVVFGFTPLPSAPCAYCALVPSFKEQATLSSIFSLSSLDYIENSRQAQVKFTSLLWSTTLLHLSITNIYYIEHCVAGQSKTTTNVPHEAGIILHRILGVRGDSKALVVEFIPVVMPQWLPN